MEYSYTDPYLLELIREAMEDEAEGVKEYRQMAELAQNQDKEIFNKIAMDEEKHYKMLQEIYDKLNNSTVTPVKMKSVEIKAVDKEKKGFVNKKVERVELYRVMYFCLKQPEFKNYVFEIMSDEQNHALLMCGR